MNTGTRRRRPHPGWAGQRWDGFMEEVEFKFDLEEGLFSHSQEAGERLGSMNKMKRQRWTNTGQSERLGLQLGASLLGSSHVLFICRFTHQ